MKYRYYTGWKWYLINGAKNQLKGIASFVLYHTRPDDMRTWYPNNPFSKHITSRDHPKDTYCLWGKHI